MPQLAAKPGLSDEPVENVEVDNDALIALEQPDEELVHSLECEIPDTDHPDAPITWDCLETLPLVSCRKKHRVDFVLNLAGNLRAVVPPHDSAPATLADVVLPQGRLQEW